MKSIFGEEFIQRSRRFTCRGCQHEGLEPVLDFGHMPASDRFLNQDELSRPEPRYPLELAFCGHCSLLQILETVDPQALFGENYLYYSSYSDSWLTHSKTSANGIISRYGLDENSLVLELASNDGYLLQFFKQQGVPVLGIDPAPGPAAAAGDKGIETINRFFTTRLAEELIAEGVKADVVITKNVLAHIADMHDFIQGIDIILKTEGAWIIEVPYVRDLVEGGAFDTIYHEHLCYFSVKALQQLLARHQLSINEIHRLDSHGGSLRLHVGRNTRVDESVTRLLDEECSAGLHEVDYYQEFAGGVVETSASISALLENLAAQGHHIAAYGAAAKGTILLNCLGDAARHIAYVADRNVFKQGKWIPGVQIPILPPDTIISDRPDYLLLLPWNLQHEILAQQQAYRDRGGKFIIPLPAPRIV